MPTPTAQRADLVLDALADPARRRVVELLGRSGPQRAGALASHAGTSASTMSRHLRCLLDAGVVVDERVPSDARARVFSLRPESLTTLEAWVVQLKAHWDTQLGSYRRHTEERSAK